MFLSAFRGFCVVPKALTLYTPQGGMGKKNKVVKLTDKKIKHIIRAKIRGESTKDIARDLKLSPSTVKRVWMHWTRTKMQLNIKKFGRKKKTLDEESVKLILEVNKEQNLGARWLEKVIEFKHGIHIPHNAIHKVLLSHGLAKVNRNKSKRRRPWIRYERDHSLSLMHLDWHTSDHNGKNVHVCVVLDDSSRFILAGGEFDAETTDNAIQLLKEAVVKYGHLASIEQVLTDRGAQFYANKRDKNGNAESRFEFFLEENKIKHIKSRVNHPQTNGKVEKWNDTYEINRFRFENFNNFVNWYNSIRFHESLDTKWYLQTPEIAFWARLPEGCKLGMFLNRMETELNDLQRI
jgi:putative transposase